MKIKYLFLLSSLLCILATACSDSDEVTPGKTDNKRKDIVLTRAQQDIVDSQAKFAFNFFKRTSEYVGNEDNFVISPLSLSIELAMLANGADDPTYRDISSAMNLADTDLDELNRLYKTLSDELPKMDSGVELCMANAMLSNSYIPCQIKIKDEFKNLIHSNYNADVQAINFNDKENSLNIINDWAAEKTNGKINSIIDDINGSEILILANATYFKANWSTPFDKSLTDMDTFFNIDNTETMVETMHTDQGRYQYVSLDDVEVVRLPYGNEAYSMYVIVPKSDASGTDSKSQFDEFTENLSYTWWRNIKNNISNHSIKISMPKFKNESKYESIGMTFFPELSSVVYHPELKRMTDNETGVIFINQSTVLEVSEEGTEAAAVTIAEIMGGSISNVPPIEMNIDRPFIYLIEEQSTGAILFMGHVVKL